MRSNRVLTALLVTTAVVGTAPAAAQMTQSAPVTPPGQFGLGFVLGEPSGVNAKLWRGRDFALVGGLAWSFAHDGATTLYGDFIWHRFGLFDLESGNLPLYVGVGARMQFENDSRFGIRTVFGLDYIFARSPFDAFFELVPTFDVAPDADVTLTAAVGFRYYFQ